MKTGKIITFAITGVFLILIASALFWFKGYYDERYKLDDNYYTVVPLDYEISPFQALDSDRKEVGILKATYTLTGYNADGKARELTFDVFSDRQDFYPPGTYVKVSMSKLFATGKAALDASDVPEKAMEKIKETFTPSVAQTPSEYAAERTSQLGSRNTPTVTVYCEAEDNTIVYTYLYAVGAKELAVSSAELLDPVYKSQFRTDKQTIPALTAIFLEIKLDDGTVLFSQKYDEIVKFGYELSDNTVSPQNPRPS